MSFLHPLPSPHDTGHGYFRVSKTVLHQGTSAHDSCYSTCHPINPYQTHHQRPLRCLLTRTNERNPLQEFYDGRPVFDMVDLGPNKLPPLPEGTGHVTSVLGKRLAREMIAEALLPHLERAADAKREKVRRWMDGGPGEGEGEGEGA